MDDFSVLIGGKAGEGINKAGEILAHLLGRIGYRTYMYYDYPSLIRGGHNFSIIRGSEEGVAAHRSRVDMILALNQDTVDFHADKLAPDGVLIYDSDYAKAEGMGIPLTEIIKTTQAPVITKNSGIIGAFARACGIDWGVVEVVLRRDIPAKVVDTNLAVARSAYEAASDHTTLPRYDQEVLPFVTGNEALSLGFVRAGLTSYIAYPMTPSSSVLHFLAQVSDVFGLKVIHPENEIAVMLMALGAACGGERVAVGTSGGGFCLMTEGFSLAGMAEIPIAVVLGQRTGPSTGLPTYSGQTELHFIRYAGHGEFPRFVASPGDAEQAYRWAAVVLNMAWKYQTPAVLLVDKNLCEGGYSFALPPEGEVTAGDYLHWQEKGPYHRYQLTDSGISPLAILPRNGEVIKINGYYHDERGITTEKPDITAKMQEKLLRKWEGLRREVEDLPSVIVEGNPDSPTALVCWGSTVGASREVARSLDLRMIQPVVLWPLPVGRFRKAIEGVDRLLVAEHNATGQLATLLSLEGFRVDGQIHRYDGRPFTVEELEEKVRGALS